MNTDELPQPRIPVSTYRVQFNKSFTFTDAQNIIGYLQKLGISDVYASPYFKAKEGSPHGYDIVDHNMLNPELGAEEDYNAFVYELQKHEMGQMLDIVPNHMCIDSKENAWWRNVLENGPSSRYAGYFDINWNPLKKELKNRILLPILGDQFGAVLENQELRLSFEDGAFFISYYDNKFPINPRTYRDILSYRIEDLQERLPVEGQHYQELLSIITDLNNVPSYSKTNAEKIKERYREQGIIKRRLFDLYHGSPSIRAFIDETITIFNGKKGSPKSFDLLDQLLRKQAYRLSFWRVATEEINYRRFFDVNSLAAIRVENPLVFEDTHRLIMQLIQEGKVTGLRIDHPDGLYNPSEYFHMLQKYCFLHTQLRTPERLRKEFSVSSEWADIKTIILQHYDKLTKDNPYYKPFYIVGEKILMRGERMPEDWPIFSTTGYAFLNFSNGIFIDMQNTKAFDDIYTRLNKTKQHFLDIVYEKKKLIMQVAMSSEINTLGHSLDRISEKNRHTRDFTLNSLTDAIIEVIAYFPVYRTYTNSYVVNEKERQYIEAAVKKAIRKNPAINVSIFEFLKDVLLLNIPEDFNQADKREWLDFVMRFQKITGPVMAKGTEDTAYYVYNRLVSLNEVGGTPERFGLSLEAFHGQNIERSKFWPHALITTSTHDTKRSEDVRARINVLSEIPREWRRHLMQWRRLNRKKRVIIDGQTVPDPNEEYLLYQTLIGAWPLYITSESEYDHFEQRIKDYMIKAIREAKVNTSWISPNTMYEDAFVIFLERILKKKPETQFLKEFIPFQKKIAHYGLYNSLSQTLLKITSPGVADFYQGTEIWNFSLVDPDNRKPVDYSLRKKMLTEIKKREKECPLSELARDFTMHKENGMAKLYLIYKALHYRKDNRELFEKSEYLPLEVIGEKSDSVCAYARREGHREIIVVVPRFLTKCVDADEVPLGTIWGDTSLLIPFFNPGVHLKNIFTGDIMITEGQNNGISVPIAEIFARFPAAMIERIE